MTIPKEHAPVMLDADVRTMPTNDEFRAWLDAKFGLGYYGSQQVGEDIARRLAKYWNIVLVENKNV